MKEKLFRGKRVDNGMWIEGELLYNGGNPIIVPKTNYKNVKPITVKQGLRNYITTPSFHVNPETIGQYILDIGVKKAFEGDIIRVFWYKGLTLKDSNYNDYVLIWSGCSDYPAYILEGYADSDSNSVSHAIINYFCEIVGTIYD